MVECIMYTYRAVGKSANLGDGGEQQVSKGEFPDEFSKKNELTLFSYELDCEIHCSTATQRLFVPINLGDGGARSQGDPPCTTGPDGPDL